MIQPSRLSLALALTTLSLTLPGLTATAQEAQSAADAGPTLLGDIFTDDMVIQQGAPVVLWGTAAPQADVIAELGGTTRRVTAGEDGRWQAEFPALEGEGPFALSASSGDVVDTVDNAIAGDVWLCSGQSNMEYPVRRALNPDSVIGSSANDSIRLFSVQQSAAAAPRDTLAGAPSWEAAGPDTVGDFSAACYFFGQALQAEHDVPLGLIHSSWGGSQIEAWISPDTLAGIGLDDEKLALLNAYAEDEVAGAAQFGAIWEEWWAGEQPDDSAPWDATPQTISGWTQAPDTMESWTNWDGMESLTGIVWFANTVTLDETQAGEGASLHLGGVDEVDTTWINGEFIGSTFGWGTAREYDIQPGVLREGENTIVTAIYNSWGAGGMTGPNEEMRLDFANAESAALGQGWHMKIAPDGVSAPPRAPWESISGLAGLYNGMIAPLGPIALKGAAWYQGESDTATPDTYATYLDGLITDWRDQFGEDMAFIVVQLANFGTPATTPAASGWAQVREAQRAIAAANARNGLAVTIDAGNPTDIHPADKKKVGERIAITARHIAYGENTLDTGPMPTNATRGDDAVTVSFEGTGGMLETLSAANATAVELCGDTQESCRFATARADGNSLVIDAGDGPATRVRYCWADAPVCNIYGENGLPATPFEMAISD